MKAMVIFIEKKLKKSFLKNPRTINKKQNKMLFSSSANFQYFFVKISEIDPIEHQGVKGIGFFNT
jgi:hypothetical protein